MKTYNDILVEYHKKFDDSEFTELVNKIEDMVYPRGEFFRDFANTDSLGQELQDKMEDIWRDFDSIPSELNDLMKVIDDLRRKVQGLSRCNACGKIKELRPKLLVSAIGTGNIYIGNLCEPCYNSKHLCMNSKIKVTKDLKIPEGLTEQEVEIIKEFQSGNLPIINNVKEKEN